MSPSPPEKAQVDKDESDKDEERRRLRERVFGDVLPDTTGDERDGGADRSESGNDEWLRSNVPPHHG